MSSRLVRVCLVISLSAWSGLLLAEVPTRVADDMSEPTPRRHAPPRRAPKKKKKPRKSAPIKRKAARDAGTRAIAPVAPDPRLASVPAAPADAGTAPPAPPHKASPDVGEGDEDDDDPADGDAGALEPAEKRAGDAGTDASDEEDDEEEYEEHPKTTYELGAEAAAESRLVWRGLAESRGAVVQASGWAGLYGLRVEGWESNALTSEGTRGPMSVVGADVSASYAIFWGNLRVVPELALLYFPERLSSSSTAEASLEVSYRFGDFHVVSGTNFDVKSAPGAYFGTLGLRWGHARPPWSVRAVVDVGWATSQYNDEYLGKDVGAIDVVHGGVSLRYDLGSVLYLNLHVDASGLVTPALSAGVQDPVLVVGGAAIGIDWSVGR